MTEVKLHNPYLEEFVALKGETNPISGLASMIHPVEMTKPRHHMAPKYSWAVPNEEAISKLANYPVTEMGAGKGYWASLIAQMGGEIQAYDLKQAENHFIDKNAKWFPVVNLFKPQLMEKVVQAAEEGRTLFLCWPSYKESWAFRYLEKFLNSGGKRVIYVGEMMEGCCAEHKFFHLLATMNTIEEIEIPRWLGIYDYMIIKEIG